MKRTLTLILSSLISLIGFSQPVLNFTPQTLSGPALVQPVDITGCGDGSGRLFIVEKRGTVRIVLAGEVLSSFFLDIESQVMNSGERGLLGLAFHPLYPATPYIYVNYVITGTITNRISRFTLNPNNANDIQESTELILLEQTGVQTNHKAGDLAFGPDGYLYFGMGDGGGGGDPDDNGQDTAVLLGKILRIDVNTPDPPLNYSIPPDNPFANSPGLDEIWAYGMRNPWRLSFDRVTGELWVADVGQNLWEEIDLILDAGLNFGWDCKEGNHNYEPAGCPGNEAFTWPVFEYPHSCNPCPVGYGASVTGGFVYRGEDYPVLEGHYVCADYISNYLWMLKQIPGSDPPEFDVFVQNGNGLVSGLVTFGEDDDGELYASNLAGTLYAVSASGPLPVQWEKLIATRSAKGNKIQWTIHEIFDIDHFDVQQSYNPAFNEFISLGHVPPVQDQLTYTYEHIINTTNAIYYRVAAHMNDGSTEYSPVARILPIAATGPSLVFDSHNRIWRIDLPEEWSSGEITLYDLQGKEVFQRRINEEPLVELGPPIVSGCYFVKISGEMGTWSDQLIW